MSTQQKTPASTVGPWLRANGMNLGSLTGQDFAALRAAAEILGCFRCCDQECEPHLLKALRCVVMTMLPHNRRFVYHAIAHALDWHMRAVIWERAEIPPLEEHPGYCTYERAPLAAGGAS